jgi:hypothetical protein
MIFNKDGGNDLEENDVKQLSSSTSNHEPNPDLQRFRRVAYGVSIIMVLLSASLEVSSESDVAQSTSAALKSLSAIMLCSLVAFEKKYFQDANIYCDFIMAMIVSIPFLAEILAETTNHTLDKASSSYKVTIAIMQMLQITAMFYQYYRAQDFKPKLTDDDASLPEFDIANYRPNSNLTVFNVTSIGIRSYISNKISSLLKEGKLNFKYPSRDHNPEMIDKIFDKAFDKETIDGGGLFFLAPGENFERAKSDDLSFNKYQSSRESLNDQQFKKIIIQCLKTEYVKWLNQLRSPRDATVAEGDDDAAVKTDDASKPSNNPARHVVIDVSNLNPNGYQQL